MPVVGHIIDILFQLIYPLLYHIVQLSVQEANFVRTICILVKSLLYCWIRVFLSANLHNIFSLLMIMQCFLMMLLLLFLFVIVIALMLLLLLLSL